MKALSAAIISTWNPSQESQQDVEKELAIATSLQEHRKWWEEEGQDNQTDVCSSNVSAHVDVDVVVIDVFFELFACLFVCLFETFVPGEVSVAFYLFSCVNRE